MIDVSNLPTQALQSELDRRDAGERFKATLTPLRYLVRVAEQLSLVASAARTTPYREALLGVHAEMQEDIRSQAADLLALRDEMLGLADRDTVKASLARLEVTESWLTYIQSENCGVRTG